MQKLLRYWRQNKKRILITIGVIAFVIFLIQFFNIIAGNSLKEKNENNTNQSKIEQSSNPAEVITSDKKISDEKAKENGELIKQFIEYCNQKKYNEGFELLSNSCKKEIFNNNVNSFKQDYVDKIFDTQKTYSIFLWTLGNRNYTYQVKYFENNLLATGGETTNKNTEDYITIVKENGENKLNIKNFIFYEELNKTVSQKDVEITIHDRKVYKTYENYNITVKNNTNNTISVSVANSEEDIYLVDENETKYKSMLYEIPQHFLNIKSKYQTNISLNFNKVYNTYRETKRIEFGGLVLNYEEYTKNPNNDLEKLSININI